MTVEAFYILLNELFYDHLILPPYLRIHKGLFEYVSCALIAVDDINDFIAKELMLLKPDYDEEYEISIEQLIEWVSHICNTYAKYAHMGNKADTMYAIMYDQAHVLLEVLEDIK